MKRFYQQDEQGFTDHLELNRQTAFHEAGHAAALYLENKRNNLPPVYFQIDVSKANSRAQPLLAKVHGGRLVGDLATVIREAATHDRDSTDIDHYPLVYEADMISFLAGPIAEATYVSLRDNEVFNSNLLTPHALNHYGGNADLLAVMSYLECFLPLPEQREVQLKTLFAKAFSFVQQPNNWKIITALAHYILNNAYENISCEQAIEVLVASEKTAIHRDSRLGRFMKAGCRVTGG
jgi:hypothetical protein